LSYGLAEGGKRPLFGMVVLDEAFSKSSHAVARRIINALTELGLHTLFVTSNQELRLWVIACARRFPSTGKGCRRV
jgi:uncharacterized protein YPO0396